MRHRTAHASRMARRRYVASLREACETKWNDGKRRCDAVSLSGRPCIHALHQVGRSGGASALLCRRPQAGFIRAADLSRIVAPPPPCVQTHGVQFRS